MPPPRDLGSFPATSDRLRSRVGPGSSNAGRRSPSSCAFPATFGNAVAWPAYGRHDPTQLAQERDARPRRRSRASRHSLHAVLDRRSSRRTARHVRRPVAGEVAVRSAPRRRDRRRPRGLALRRQGVLPSRAQRGRRPQARGLEGRADPLRGDAPRLLRHRRAHPRHGHQRRVGVGELPVADHGLLRFGVLALQRPRARARGDPRVERLVLRRVVFRVSRSHRADGDHVSRRCRARPPRRSAATRHGASPR